MIQRVFCPTLLRQSRTQHPHIGQELLGALQSSQPPAIEHVLHSLINQLAAIPNRVILVLDDYHVVDNQAIHSALAFILDYLPPQMVLVLLTRTDPPLPLARLRARRELLEFRAASLRFSVEEANQFLNQTMQLGLPSDSVSALDSHTEGWIAGLQLAAIAMQTLSTDKQVFVQNFTGSNRFVLDYLIEEVLSRQPENIRRFLLQTSILHRLNGALCRAITGEIDGQALIEYLERNNLFLVPLDQSRHWYRYHHLFGDLLQTKLIAEYPTTLNELRQRAAQWHAQNGFPEDAVVYALAAEDFEYAAYLITGPAVQVARRGEAMTLLDWYKAFPPDFVFDNPRLSLHFGLGFALNGRWDEAEILLNKIQQQDIETRPADVLLLAYLVASYRHDAGQLAAIADEAANAHPDPTTKLVLALITSMSGNFRYACQLLAEAQDGSERQGEVSQALTALFHNCRFRVFLGDLHQAYTLSQHALHRINESGNTATALPMAIFAHVSLGRIFIEWNDHDNATFHLAQAIRLAELTGFVTGIISGATMMLAEVKVAQGDTEGANQTAEAAITHAQRYDPPSEVTWLKTYQTRIWLAQGNVAAAIDWMRSAQDQQPPSMFYPNTIQTVTHARTLLAQRKPKSAIALLTRLPPKSPDLLTVDPSPCWHWPGKRKAIASTPR